MPGPAPVRVLFASYLEPHLVDRIRWVDPRIAVTYRADLVGQQRAARSKADRSKAAS